jgi:hypothetical protein
MSEEIYVIPQLRCGLLGADSCRKEKLQPQLSSEGDLK